MNKSLKCSIKTLFALPFFVLSFGITLLVQFPLIILWIAPSIAGCCEIPESIIEPWAFTWIDWYKSL